MDKWEDTVMGTNVLSALLRGTTLNLLVPECIDPKGSAPSLETFVAQKQAEITWDIAFKTGYLEGHNKGWNDGAKAGEDKGKQEGFDKVVEWIQKNHVELIPYGEPAICILTSEWQTFVKERDEMPEEVK